MTCRRYRGITEFVDHATKFIYTSIFKGATNNKMVFGKFKYKYSMRQYSYSIKYYRVDNSRFDSYPFQNSYKEADQSFLYYSIGVYH